MRATGMALLLVLVWSSAAVALEAPAPAAPDHRSEALAVAKAEGDMLLRRAGAEDLFVNETGTGRYTGILLRHRASGFACMLTPGQALNAVTIYPNLHRGDDVGCQTMTLHGSLTTNFTRDRAHSDDQVIQGAERALQMHVPDARPAPPPTHVQSYAALFPSAPPPKSVRYVTSHSFEEDVLGHVGDWIVETRFTAPAAMADSNFLDVVWYATVDEAARARSAAAQASDPQAAGPPAPPSPPKTSTPPTPADLALARSEADRIVLAAKAQAAFENASEGRVPGLRHRVSGLVCRFNPGAANSVSIASGTPTPAEAVTCVTGADAYMQITTVAPNTLHLTADGLMRQQLALLRQATHDLKLFQGPTIQANIKPKDGSSLPEHKSAQVIFPVQGADEYLYISTAVVGDWMLTEQLRGPPNHAQIANLMGELTLLAAMHDVLKAGMPAVASPPPVA